MRKHLQDLGGARARARECVRVHVSVRVSVRVRVRGAGSSKQRVRAAVPQVRDRLLGVLLRAERPGRTGHV